MRKSLVAVSVAVSVVAIAGPVLVGRASDEPVAAATGRSPSGSPYLPDHRGQLRRRHRAVRPHRPLDHRPEQHLGDREQVPPDRAVGLPARDRHRAGLPGRDTGRRPVQRLLDASDRRGLGFKIASAFRSYDYQLHVHAATAAARGDAEADLLSARAGYSEHQTGLAVDLVTPADPACDFEACFARTPGGRWLARTAWRFGFVVRYQPATTAVTGYAPEPWHLRYVGRPLAAELHRTGIATLEEFFGVPGGDYPTS